MDDGGRSSWGGAGEAEKAKKIYRYVSDTARRIDEATPACKTTSDLFTIHMESLRQKLRDNCEKLMFLDPLAYGRKSLELLWRKAYYETVSMGKKLRNKEEDYDNYISTHIVCGIGHYHHIISRIQTELDVEISCFDYPPMSWEDDGKGTKLNMDDDIKQWGLGIIHSCLIYLGDLSRYQSEMFDFDTSIAARYYLQAAYLDVSSGMPYNQLGNLYTDRNHNLDSVCYYMHCLSCAVPFEGADGNLSRLFEKNAQFVDSVALEDFESFSRSERVKLSIARVLILTENWYVGKENIDVAQLCNLTAQDLKVCLSYEEPILPDINKNYDEFVQRSEEEILTPSYLSHDSIYKIVKICLFCIEKVSEVDPNKSFAVKAFTLALFSQLLQKLLEKMLKCGFLNPSRMPRRPTYRRNENDLKEESKPDVDISQNGLETQVEKIKEAIVGEVKVNGHLSELEENVVVNGTGKSNGKKIAAKRRRRRRLNSSESSEESDDETESSSLETEESGSEDDGSSHSDDSEDLNDEHKIDNIKKSEEVRQEKLLNNKHSTISEVNKRAGKINEIEIQNFLRGNNFLPSLKLLQDWVLTETDLILSCGESGEALFQSVVDLLNILRINFTNKAVLKNRPSCKILNFARSLTTKWKLEFKLVPLPEDVNLRATNICKFDKNAAEWDLVKKLNPSIYEENAMRILNFIHFGEQMADIVPRIRYNRTMQIFFIKKKPVIKVVRKDVKKKLQRSPPKPHSGRHNHPGETSLMRNLGKLWLQSQVRELESAVRAGGGGREALPAYLAVDTDALTHHTALVKQLVRARRFIVLVPTVVLQSIDDLKKEQGGARDAIRWLESQLQSGSRFLRTQRPGETRPLPLLRYPRKAPKHVHQYVQIVEFCHHFVARDGEAGGAGDHEHAKRPSAVLVLLTGTKLTDVSDEKDFSYTGVAQSAGVPVDCIVHFFSKWRHLLNKTGKKR